MMTIVMVATWTRGVEKRPEEAQHGVLVADLQVPYHKLFEQPFVFEEFCQLVNHMCEMCAPERSSQQALAYVHDHQKVNAPSILPEADRTICPD